MASLSIPQAAIPLLGGGADILIYAASQEQASVQIARVRSAENNAQQSAIQFRPPEWSQPSLTMITIPSQSQRVVTGGSTTSQINASAFVGNNGVYTLRSTAFTSTVGSNTAPQLLIFDAVLRATHAQEARPTSFPIQAGANIADHVILDPAHLTLDILMTDVLPAYAGGQWVGNASKSISCFQVLDALRASFIPVTVTTRLKTYSNMILTNVLADDTLKTRYGLEARVEFHQVFLSAVASQTSSARPQTLQSTPNGAVNPSVVPAGVTTQNFMPPPSSTRLPNVPQVQPSAVVPGAGNWSSNATSSIGS